ncbi:GNAT family N-acetyltransferase [Chamaesiphon polymorphus]|uniref:N-acetyltransferase domain-containing protein n=1 Tax=Chamaesiphon polymorphus CCALA 037 TaxID=2107692 RepID=A0A2T1GDE5_9CYAN|nr:GNAT family N-acetyltransferase [Chamaesiphon polymorphus]PSB55444.1 hypothetical protein C7B77_14970 [Chamaesiphon polymorphus CCALA 037]
MEISIRTATAEDLETIIALQTLSLSNLPDYFRKYDRRQIDSLIAGQAKSRSIVFPIETNLIAEDDRGKPIGFISILNCKPKISGLFVHPDYMNRGVGKQLLKKLELLAIEQRIGKLGVMSSMESVAFYEKNGYQFKRKTGFFSKGWVWIPCKLLEKELIPTPLAERLAEQTVKIVMLLAFLAIITNIIYKAERKQICSPTPDYRVCTQIDRP